MVDPPCCIGSEGGRLGGRRAKNVEEVDRQLYKGVE